MIVKRIFKIFLFIVLFFPNVFSKDLKVSLSVYSSDKDVNGNGVVYLKEPFHVKVTVSGEGKNNPIIDGLDQFNVYGSETSQQVSIINNRISSQTIYKYTIDATEEGEFVVGPACIKDGGKEVKSKSSRVVVKVRDRVSTQNEKKSSTTKKSQFFCELTADKKNVVLGEPILVFAKVFYSNPEAKVVLETPELSEFFVKEVSDENLVSKVKTINGEEFYFIERKFVLMPLTNGEKNIPPFRVLCREPVKQKRRSIGLGGFLNVDSFDFFGPRYQEGVIASNKLSLNVYSLPEYGGRVDGVGAFRKFETRVDTTKVCVNEPITLSVEIEGEGNFQQIETPKLQLPQSFKYYESKSDFKDNINLGLSGGSKRFEYIVQGEKAGDWQVEPQKFTYFDVEEKKYKTLTSKPIKINITPSLDENSQNLGGVLFTKSDKDEEYIKDIGFIEDTEVEYLAQHQSIRISWWFFVLLLLLPTLLVFGTYVSILWRRIINFKPKDPFYSFKLRLKRMKEDRETDKLYTLFLDFFAEKFNISRSELTQDKLCEKLKYLEWPQNLVDEFLDYLNICASLSFSSMHGSEDDKLSVLKRAEKWFLRLNNNWIDSDDF